MYRFGVAAGRVGSSAFRFGDCPRRVDSSAFCFGDSARWLAFGFTASAFRHAPLWSCPRRVGFYAFRFGVAARRVGLRAHCFRFSACAASEWLLGEFVLPPSASEIPLGGLAFGLTASAFRHAPLRSGRWADWPSGFRFGVASAGWFFRWAGWSSGSLLPLFGMHRFGVALGGLILPLGGLAFGLTASAFRHAPLRSGRWASWFFRLPLRKLPSAGWPSGSLLPLFGMRRFGVAAGRVGSSAFRFGDGRRASWPSGSLLPLFGTHRSAPPCRRSEDRRSTPTRHLFHFKTLIPTC